MKMHGKPLTDRRWIDDFVVVLRLHDVPGERIGDLVAEVEDHCAQSGQSPTEAFGAPRDYADECARDIAAPRTSPAGWARVLSPTVAGLLGFLLVGPSIAAWREGTGVTIGWGVAVALALNAVAVVLLLRLGDRLLTSRVAGTLVLGSAFVVIGLAPLLAPAPAFRLPVAAATVVSVLLLVVSVVGAYTWGRVEADPVTRPWDGADRYSGTRDGRVADAVMALQPWMFVIAAVVFAGVTWALGGI